ncbi:MAG: hypothetical protein HUU35_08015 [Armatimonadetes bacterium]|nr:hypothetical protein [Armatimonadota bacterium]
MAVHPLFKRLVALGDSVSQGTQNVGVSVRSQPYSLPALLARQAGADFPLPLLAEPGYPPHTDQLGTVIRSRVTHPELLQGQRLEPRLRPRNFAIAGARLADVAGLTCANMGRLPRTTAVRRMMRLVLNPLGHPAWETMTQVDRTVAEEPTAVLLWAGANDVLEALFYPHYGVTTPADFERLWRRLIGRLLAETAARIIVLTIPDVTTMPLLRVWQTRPALQQRIRRTVQRFNQSIVASQELSERVLVVDLQPEMTRIAAEGVLVDGWRLPYQVKRGRLDFEPLRGVPGVVTSGGLISFDGLHPTRIGYGVLANVVLADLRARWGVELPPVDLEELARGETMLLKPDPYSWPLLRGYLRSVYGRGVRELERGFWPAGLTPGG